MSCSTPGSTVGFTEQFAVTSCNPEVITKAKTFMLSFTNFYTLATPAVISHRFAEGMRINSFTPTSHTNRSSTSFKYSKDAVAFMNARTAASLLCAKPRLAAPAIIGSRALRTDYILVFQIPPVTSRHRCQDSCGGRHYYVTMTWMGGRLTSRASAGRTLSSRHADSGTSAHSFEHNTTRWATEGPAGVSLRVDYG